MAIWHEVKRKHPRAEVFYIGQSGDTIEARLCAHYGIPFCGIQAGKLRRYVDVKNIVDAFRVPVGMFQALRVLRRERPDFVFAKGGYVSVPVVIAAHMLGIPIYLHESDVTPGLANKICARFAKKVFVSFEETRQYFAGEVQVVGNPVRKEIFHGNKEKGYAFTGLQKNRPVLLVLGGSTGAVALNKIIEHNLSKLLEHTQIVHVMGPGKSFKQRPRHTGYVAFEYLQDELPHVYAIADFVISRAGSGTIFETLVWNKPMLLVPLPAEGSRGDQIENAQAFVARGWAGMIEQEKTSAAEFAYIIKDFLSDQKALDAMKVAQKKTGVRFARESVEKIAIALA